MKSINFKGVSLLVFAGVIHLLLGLPVSVRAASDPLPNRNYFKLCILNEDNKVLLDDAFRIIKDQKNGTREEEIVDKFFDLI